jgi:hypothetical protein
MKNDEEIAALPAEEHLRLAADPGADPETLRHLCRLCEEDRARQRHWRYGKWKRNEPPPVASLPDVRHLIAANPNTPPDVLASLATAFPAEFCANPVAALVLLEVPDFAAQLVGLYGGWLYEEQVDSLRPLLQRGDLPGAVAAGLAREAEAWPAAATDLKEELRWHIAVVGEAEGDGWRDELCAVVRETAARLSAPDRQVLDSLLAIGAAPSWLAPFLRGREDGSDTPRPVVLRDALRRLDVAAPLCRAVGWMRPGERLDGLRPEMVVCLPWLERLGVALNPRVSANACLLECLAGDGNRFVRAAFRERLPGRGGQA